MPLISGSMTVAPDPLSVVGGTPMLSRVAHHPGSSGNSCLSDGTSTWCVSQFRHEVTVAGSQLRLVFANVSGYEAIGAAIVDEPVNSVTYSCTLWTGCLGTTQANSPGTTGTPHDVTLDGSTSWTLGPGAVGISDPLPNLTFTVGQVIFTRTLVTVTAGQKWVLGKSTTPGFIEGFVKGTGTPPDYLHGTSITAISSSTNPHGPVLTMGVAA